LNDNGFMPASKHLHVGITDLSPIRVAHKLCIFPVNSKKPYGKINETFRSLREWAVIFGLDPDALLHIGLPSLDDKGLIAYGCCIEFPLPVDEISADLDLRSLPGGRYAILRIEKKPGKISKAIRHFHGDYIPENQIILDESRPVYEIYYADTMEYCLPVIDG